jgi:hypothetical protein
MRMAASSALQNFEPCPMSILKAQWNEANPTSNKHSLDNLEDNIQIHCVIIPCIKIEPW